MPTAVGRYQFTHALIQETLAEELSLTRRVRLHARIAETLEELYGDNAANYAAELAHHFTQAEAMLGNEKLVEYSTVAGERALSNYAYEDAQSHFQSALASKEGQPMDDQTATIYHGLGQAQAGTLPRSELQAAVDSLRMAFDYYSQTTEPSRAIQVALFPFPRVHGLTGLSDLFMQASKLARPNSSEAGFMLAQYGLFAGFETGEYEPSETAFSRALEIARLNKDTGLEMQILMRSGLVDVTHLKPQADQKLIRAFEFSKQSTQSTNLQVQAAAAEGIALYSRKIGNPDNAQNYLLEGLEAARKLRHKIVLVFAYSNLACHAASVGDWKSVEEYSDQALALDPHEMRAVTPRVLCDYNLGEFERAAHHVMKFLEIEQENIYPFSLPALAMCARISDDRELIESLIPLLEKTVTEQGLEPRTHMMTRAGLGLVAVHKLDPQAAEIQYTALTQYPSVDFMILAGISNQRLLGLLSHTIGNLEASQGHFEDALTFCRQVGYRPELAWSLHDCADMLLERNEPGDQQTATAMLDEALQISTDLAMRPLMERALSKRDILKA
jgi:tetratricopeptide (TPR) repeat protein